MTVRVRNQTRDKILADHAQLATGFWERLRGLMGRTQFDVGEGLHIVPCNSFHTFFMRLPIDALFLDREGGVVKVHHCLAPWRATAIYFRAHSVLELPAGTAAASGCLEGDRLAFEKLATPPKDL